MKTGETYEVKRGYSDRNL